MKVCVITSDSENIAELVSVLSQYNVGYDILTNSDAIAHTYNVGALPDNMYESLLDDAQSFVQYDSVLTLNYTSIISEYCGFQLIQIDFDSEQLIILGKVIQYSHYIPILSAFALNNTLQLTFQEPINLFNQEINVVDLKPNYTESVDKIAPFTAYVQQKIDQALEMHSFQYIGHEFDSSTNGYVVVQKQLDRFSGQMFYSNKQFIYQFAVFKILSQKQGGFYFEKYFLHKIEEKSYVVINNEEDKVKLSKTNPLKQIVFNLTQQPIQQLNENYTIINYSWSGNDLNILGKQHETLYQQFKNEFHSCQIANHPNLLMQCYLKCYEIQQYIINNNFSSEFISTQEKNAINASKQFGFDFLKYYLFNYQIKQQLKNTKEFKGQNREPIVQFDTNAEFDTIINILEQHQTVLTADEIQSNLAQFSNKFNNLSMISDLETYELTILRAQSYQIPYDSFLIRDSICTTDLTQIKHDLLTALPANTNTDISFVQIHSNYELVRFEPPATVFSAKFGQFSEKDFLDFYHTQNALIKNKPNQKLNVQCKINTVQDIIDTFSDLNIEISQIFTKNGKMMYAGCGNEDRIIIKYLKDKNEFEDVFGIFNVGCDDGEEIPMLRIWW
ncbi:Conserved_hypothetical protein [Hexamita inflata]|uniref:Uncharacterized protein n=1 Tax=Hexamita inflata TaxID=28002 RepID=A0AA86PCJ0_9EUKA|nr:Conserved hypothetical protein [Hexamita inflata]